MGGSAKKVTKRISSGVSNVVKNPTNLGAHAQANASVFDPTGIGQKTLTGQDPLSPEVGGGGVNYKGMPTRPEFQSFLQRDEAGKFKSSLDPALTGSEILGQQGRDALKAQALAQGRSPWANLQIEQQGLEESNALSQLGKQQNVALAQAQGNLARSGGLRSGVGALLQQQGMKDSMLQRAGARRQGMEDRLKIDLADQEQKNSLLKSLAGQDIQTQQGNIGNVLGQAQALNAANLGAYNSAMQAWAAKQQAQAVRDSAPKGGLLGAIGL